jgi:PiT family inorganic phosphate transporter
MYSLPVGLAAALGFVFGWNNSPLIIGNVRGAGSLSFRTILILGVAGLFLGSLLEGQKMVGSLGGSLAPSASASMLEATILVSLVLTFAMTLLDLPVSFSMVMVSAFIGATLASAVALDRSRVEEVIAFWRLRGTGGSVPGAAVRRTFRRITSSQYLKEHSTRRLFTESKTCEPCA